MLRRLRQRGFLGPLALEVALREADRIVLPDSNEALGPTPWPHIQDHLVVGRQAQLAGDAPGTLLELANIASQAPILDLDMGIYENI